MCILFSEIIYSPNLFVVTMNISDLPVEIIKIIFDFLPNEYLVQLIDIPCIKKYTISSFYSTIIISGSWHIILHFPTVSNGIPVFRNAYNYVYFLQLNPKISPRKVIIQEPTEAIVLLNEFPEIVARSKVEINISGNELMCTDDISKILDIISSESLFSSLKLELNLKLSYANLKANISQRLTSLALTEGYGLEKLSKSTSLTTLSVNYFLTASDIKHIPRQLQNLKCSFKIEDSINFMASMKWKLPLSLRTLHIREAQYDGSKFLVVDISHLKVLQKFTIEEYDSLNCEWVYPKCLESFTCSSARMVPRNLAVKLPELSKLSIENTDGYSKVLKFMASTFPPTLVSLDISLDILAHDNYAIQLNYPQKENTDTNLTVNSWELPFKDNLKELTIRYKPSEETTGIDDITDNDYLNYENSLTKRVQKLGLSGPSLRTAVNFDLPRLQKIDINKILIFKNLDRLCLYSIEGIDVFDCKLPDSLLKLEIHLCHFKQLHIISPNIITLKLSYCYKIIKLETSNFTIPATIERLGINHTDIRKISARFPDGMELLDLSYNRHLSFVCHFPVSLKFLLLTETSIGKTVNWIGQNCVLPTKLETLYLSCAHINDKWIRKMKLSECKKLKTLLLFAGKFKKLDINLLPKSLVVLELGCCSFQSIVGSFRSLPNLELLGLFAINLQGYFEGIANIGEEMFSDNIRFVDLQRNLLVTDELELIYKELLKKPYFESLLPGTSLIIGYNDYVQMKKAKLGAYSLPGGGADCSFIDSF